MAKKTKEILITISGGMVEVISDIPKGVTLKIVDYDVDGTFYPEEIEKFEGKPAIISTFEAD